VLYTHVNSNTLPETNSPGVNFGIMSKFPGPIPNLYSMEAMRTNYGKHVQDS